MKSQQIKSYHCNFYMQLLRRVYSGRSLNSRAHPGLILLWLMYAQPLKTSQNSSIKSSTISWWMLLWQQVWDITSERLEFERLKRSINGASRNFFWFPPNLVPYNACTCTLLYCKPPTKLTAGFRCLGPQQTILSMSLQHHVKVDGTSSE